MWTLEQAQAAAQVELARCIAIARQRYGYDGVTPIRWDLRGKTGGTCHYRSGASTLRFNAHLATHEGEAYLQTVAHELAHAVVFWRCLNDARLHGRRVQPHGAEWAGVMLAFGREVRRCHNYASMQPARVVRTYTYACRCQTHNIGPVRHRRLQAGTKYACKRCGQRLTLQA